MYLENTDISDGVSADIVREQFFIYCIYEQKHLIVLLIFKHRRYKILKRNSCSLNRKNNKVTVFSHANFVKTISETLNFTILKFRSVQKYNVFRNIEYRLLMNK